MFKKILIANRGEIACRVIRTCKKLSISTVAVYSDVDKKALHVELADDAVCIGPAAPSESYLCIDKVIQAALDTGAEAIHPGYGFLSENAEFAKAVKKAGLTFIGPSAKSIEVMGAKSASKALMEKAGVPLVPGYHGDKQDEKTLLAEAEKVGFPLLIKASAGGGGKGMRVVEKKSDFIDGLNAAKREAKSAFGDDHVLIERYLTKPRHVEVQVFGDMKGNVVHLFERDCSVQRRHQKIVEEAPAPNFSKDLRQKMGAAAVKAAQAIDYLGAGTVEFLLDEDEKFYFMEMNTRLQVEHPVTEEITGQDLVEWQLIVAGGGELPLSQDELSINAHAIEVRLYAEDPQNEFLPAAGQIGYLRYPIEIPLVRRVETSVRESVWAKDGDQVSIHYDPMIAKIIAIGEDRDQAIENMQDALHELRITGLKTNLAFLQNVIESRAFGSADISTRFVENHLEELLKANIKDDDRVLVMGAVGVVDTLLQHEIYHRGGDTPWDGIQGWRQAGTEAQSVILNGKTIKVNLCNDGKARVDLNGNTYDIAFDRMEDDLALNITIDGVMHNVVTIVDENSVDVLCSGRHFVFDYLPTLSSGHDLEEASGRLTAPMPGKVVDVKVSVGDEVEKGTPLIILEAMKMEHTIFAPVDGKVSAVNANPGDQVDEKLELISFS